tara:strand:+ start:801 stop:1091 length:291 start_codon:yes stop_codon:yes gene_type:complete
MLIEASQMGIGNVIVTTTVDGGHDPAFWAQAAADRIVRVGVNCAPPIAQQAQAFKESVRATALHCIQEAIKSDRTTLIAEFERQGHKDMADIIRSL